MQVVREVFGPGALSVEKHHVNVGVDCALIRVLNVMNRQNQKECHKA